MCSWPRRDAEFKHPPFPHRVPGRVALRLHSPFQVPESPAMKTVGRLGGKVYAAVGPQVMRCALLCVAAGAVVMCNCRVVLVGREISDGLLENVAIVDAVARRPTPLLDVSESCVDLPWLTGSGNHLRRTVEFRNTFSSFLCSLPYLFVVYASHRIKPASLLPTRPRTTRSRRTTWPSSPHSPR